MTRGLFGARLHTLYIRLHREWNLSLSALGSAEASEMKISGSPDSYLTMALGLPLAWRIGYSLNH